MDTPKLLNVPSAYKAGKIYSPIPTDGGGDLTFARASAGTRVNSNGIIEDMGTDVPRLDYSGGGCPSWLLEPARTNLLTYSEQFDNAAWGKSNVTITPNATTAPNGTTTADLITIDSSSNFHLLFQQTNYTAATNYVQGYFFKANTTDIVQIYNAGNAFSPINNRYANFDLSNGVVAVSTFSDAGIFPVGNGWYYCWVMEQAQASSNGVLAVSGINSLSDGYRPTFLGAGQSLYVWGAQLEAGAYPTSYIKTEAATVTRSKDSINTTFTTPFNTTTEGSFYFSFKGLDSVNGVGSSSVFISLRQDGSNYAGVAVSNFWRGRFQIGAVARLFSSPVPVTEDVKMLLSFNPSGWEMWANGSMFASGTDVVSYTGITAITNIALDDRGVQRCSVIALFDYKLSDSEATQITT